MEYDPIKDRLATLIDLFPALRKCMYKALDMMLLRQRYVKREILANFRPKESFRFYDAGAGFCQYSWFVLQHWPNAKVFATDLKTDYLKSFSAFTNREAPDRFSYQSADLQHFTPSNSYQLCIAIDILEHIEDDQTTLKNFHQALAPEGILIISTPSDTDEAAKFTAEHVRPGYAKADLEEKLHKAGFELVKSIYTYGKFGSLAWRLMMKYPLQIAGKKLLPLLLPYYLLVYPVAELLMQLDLRMPNPEGTGILVVAQKPRA
jgi:trans-aconitate methyltransferase